MNIDAVKFICAENEYNKAMNHAPGVYHPENPQIYKNICDILGVCRIDAVYTPLGAKPITGCIYGEQSPAEGCCYVQTETAGNGATAEYSVYKKPDFPEWDGDDKTVISEFIRVMFVNNGRSSIISMAKKLMYIDSVMETGNLKAFFLKIDEINREGVLEEYGACRFNIKRFSVINRNFGRDTGTVIMKNFIDGLRPLTDDLVFRVGGDNFNLIFKKERFEEIKAYLLGTHVKTGLELPTEIAVSTRAGYYMCSNNEKNPDEIMGKITAASEMARSLSKDGCFVFDEAAKQRVEHIRIIESQFYAGLKNNELEAYYQPKVDIKTGRIIGAEALCRWIKDGRVISPAEFIPILEQSNAICQLDFYILDKVCKDIKKWLDAGNEGVKCSVNLSRMHLGDEKLLDKVIGIIDKSGVPHDLIEIELTETTTDVDFDELRRIVNGLHQSSISASVDDFGIGYSSLTLIKDLPWDVLKIDKCFLPDGSDNDKQKTIMLAHVVSMAQGLGLQCIIEGVETQEQISLLKDIHCFIAQGFYFFKPMPKQEFERRLSSQHSI